LANNARRALAAFAGMTALLAGAVTLDPKLPAYEPQAKVEGEISVAGNHATDETMLAWAAKFARFHPGAKIRLRDDTRLTTDAFDLAIAAGDIDLIPSARELVPSETERLTRKLGGPPLVVAVATGSYATKSGTHAIAYYVNAANPLERISVDQIREIYAPAGKITKWGQLGLTGEWAERPIHVFSVPISDPNGNPLGIINYLTKRVLDGKPGWRRSIYQVDSNGPAIGQHMLNRIVREVAGDRDAIGFSGFAFGAPGAKALAVAETDAGPWYAGTREEVASRVYPFTRTIYLGVNRPAGTPLRPVVREFLRFVLSRDGQAAFAEGPEKYLPLTASVASAERGKLH
jgi:phosphate transport system substrate-binding protein